MSCSTFGCGGGCSSCTRNDPYAWRNSSRKQQFCPPQKCCNNQNGPIISPVSALAVGSSGGSFLVNINQVTNLSFASVPPSLQSYVNWSSNNDAVMFCLGGIYEYSLVWTQPISDAPGFSPMSLQPFINTMALQSPSFSGFGSGSMSGVFQITCPNQSTFSIQAQPSTSGTASTISNYTLIIKQLSGQSACCATD